MIAETLVQFGNENRKYSFPICTNMETGEILRLLNGWWTTGIVSENLARKFKRKSFKDALSILTNYRQILVLTGLRRVGKSTIMYQLINDLISSVSPLKIIYFSFDFGSEELQLILREYQKITKIDWKTEETFLFLDEIQKQKNWAPQLKMIYDAFPNVKFVVSGSASLQLEREVMENLAGRYYLIDVPVLSLVEYFSLEHDEGIENARLNEDRIKLEIEPYIRKPFPELVKVADERMIYEYIRESVISKILGQDLISEFEKVEIPLLNSLINLFFSEPGMTLNYDGLARTLSKRKETIERHVYMLEFSKLIRVIKNYRPSTMSESRKLKKVYPYDISLALSYFPSLERGRVIETLLMSRLNTKRYWREGSKEVDALYETRGGQIPIEIKASNTLKPEHMKNLKFYVSKFGGNLGILLYHGRDVKIGKIRAIDIEDVLIYGFEKTINE